MEWHFHLDVLLAVALLAGLYGYALVRLRPAPRWLHPIERRHIVYFALALAALYAAEGSPLHEISERYLFSVHMTQHLLLTLVMAPLLLAATPSWLLEPFLNRPRVLAVARVIVHPVTAMALFNGTLALWHVPTLYELALQNHNVHILNHAIYIFTALLLWWPVFSPLSQLPPLSYPAQMLYLFIQSLVPAVLASVITFSETVIYPTYAAAPRLWNMEPLQDQQIGGLVMKLAGGFIMWSLAGYIFFTWFAKDEAEVEKSWD